MTDVADTGRRLSWDWYDGSIPPNVRIGDGAYIETAHSFLRFRSTLPCGATFERGSSMYKTSMLDVGPRGAVHLGEFSMLQGVRVICDREITIGDHTMLSWLVVLMDSYRAPMDVNDRRAYLKSMAFSRGHPRDWHSDAHPIRIGSKVWIGFEACILPGVTIGDGAIIGAKSVVTHDVPPFTVAAGNPARIVRNLNQPNPNDSTSVRLISE